MRKLIFKVLRFIWFGRVNTIKKPKLYNSSVPLDQIDFKHVRGSINLVNGNIRTRIDADRDAREALRLPTL